MEIVKIRLQTAALNGEVVTMGETVKEMGLKGLYRVRCLLAVYPVLCRAVPCRAVVCGASIAAGPSWASRATLLTTAISCRHDRRGRGIFSPVDAGYAIAGRCVDSLP